MSYSMDVNILLFASDTSSPLHATASGFLQSCMEGGDLFYIAWPTIMGYLRIATHPSIFNEPLTTRQAMANVQTLLDLPYCRCLGEEDGFWETWRELVGETPVRGNLVPDAHLAALLRLHGIRTLYTHDRDFRRFDFLDVRIPLLDGYLGVAFAVAAPGPILRHSPHGDAQVIDQAERSCIRRQRGSPSRLGGRTAVSRRAHCPGR